jgi:hypothetical protein
VILKRYERLVMPAREVTDSMFPDDEHVLLGCFGRDLAAVRHQTQLRLALRRAGFPAALAAQLIRDSRLSAKPAAGTGSGDATNTTPMRPIIDRHLIMVGLRPRRSPRRVHVLSAMRSTMSSGQACRRPTGASLPLVDLRLVALEFLGLFYRWAAR